MLQNFLLIQAATVAESASTIRGGSRESGFRQLQSSAAACTSPFLGAEECMCTPDNTSLSAKLCTVGQRCYTGATTAEDFCVTPSVVFEKNRAGECGKVVATLFASVRLDSNAVIKVTFPDNYVLDAVEFSSKSDDTIVGGMEWYTKDPATNDTSDYSSGCSSRNYSGMGTNFVKCTRCRGATQTQANQEIVITVDNICTRGPTTAGAAFKIELVSHHGTNLINATTDPAMTNIPAGEVLERLDCASEYPYAYQDGARCCRSNYDIWGDYLAPSSLTCEAGDSATCTSEPCENAWGTKQWSEKVNCGNHEADTCRKCPQGNGSDSCNGECQLKNGVCSYNGYTIAKGHLIKTLDTVDREYRLSFDVLLESHDNVSILHLTTGDHCCNHGNRIPLINLNSKRLHFQSSVAHDWTRGYHHNENMPLNEWVSIVVSQAKSTRYDTKYKYAISINGKTVHIVDNVTPNSAFPFKNVHVYAGSPWSEPVRGYIRYLSTA